MPRDTKELQWFRHGGGDEIHSGTQLIGYIEAMFNYLEDEGGERRIIREKSSGPSDFGKRDFRAAVLELIGSAGEMPVRDGNFGKLLRGGSITYETVLYTCTVLISMHAPEDFGTVGRGHLAILSTPFKDGGFEASCGLAMDIAAAGYMPWSPNPMSMMKLLRDGFHRMSQPGYQCPPGSVVKGVELVFKQVMCDEFWLNLFSWSLQYFNVMTGSSIFFQCLDSANEGRLGGPGQRFEAAMIKSINQLRGIPGCCPPGFANKDLTVVKVVFDRVGGRLMWRRELPMRPMGGAVAGIGIALAEQSKMHPEEHLEIVFATKKGDNVQAIDKSAGKAPIAYFPMAEFLGPVNVEFYCSNDRDFKTGRHVRVSAGELAQACRGLRSSDAVLVDEYKVTKQSTAVVQVFVKKLG